MARWMGLEARDWLECIEEDDAVLPGHFSCKSEISVDSSQCNDDGTD